MEGARFGNPSNYNKWRVRSNDLNAQGQFHSWEVETIVGKLHEYTSADVWPLHYNFGEDGAVVGTAQCDDWELDGVYGTPPESIDGQDVVLWVQNNHYHETRYQGEERQRMPASSGRAFISHRAISPTPHRRTTGDTQGDPFAVQVFRQLAVNMQMLMIAPHAASGARGRR